MLELSQRGAHHRQQQLPPRGVGSEPSTLGDYLLLFIHMRQASQHHPVGRFLRLHPLLARLVFASQPVAVRSPCSGFFFAVR